jgi:hypothetical protein
MLKETVEMLLASPALMDSIHPLLTGATTGRIFESVKLYLPVVANLVDEPVAFADFVFKPRQGVHLLLSVSKVQRVGHDIFYCPESSSIIKGFWSGPKL